MMRNVVTLTLNDLAIAFHNKTLLLIFFIPLFVFFSLKLVDQADADFQTIKIGLLQDASYPTGMKESLQSAEQIFEIFWFSNPEEGEKWLKDKKVDGILSRPADKPGSLALIVLTKNSLQTLAIVESITALQNVFEGRDENWVSDIRGLQDSGMQEQTLPTWILMLVLLVGFIILPAQVTEEKEKNLLLGLLQTPIHESEWLLAKLLLGIILICLSVVFLQMLGGFDFDLARIAGYSAFLIVGGFCFSGFGIFLGFLCRTQASARTLGVLIYLPNLLPAALSDFSQKLSSVAPLFPSYHFYGPIKSILLEEGHLSAFLLDWLYLFSLGLGMSLLSLLFMKKRWLM
jgi:ABC-2 type transport system permease protein